MMERRRLLSMFGALPTGIKAFKMGTMTLESDQSAAFTITTNLGYVPDLYAFWIKTTDNDLIPNGSAVKILYNKMAYTPSNLNYPCFPYWYAYKHFSSGNILVSQYNPNVSSSATDTIITIQRPSADWKALDVNGDPLEYQWMAIALDY